MRANQVPAGARTLALALCVAAVFAEQGFAANGAWTGAGGDNLWTNAANWTAVPGVANGTFTSPDVAIFNDASPAATIDVDANRNVAGFTYDSSLANFTIGDDGVNGGPAIHLTNGGLTQVTANVQPAAAQSFTINAPIILAGNSYTMAHNSSSISASLFVRGNITASAAGATVLTLDGSHANGNASNADLRGSITNGANGTLGLVKQGTGWWEIIASSSNPNTYSGDTVINGGTLRITADTVEGSDGLGGLSPNSNYIVNNGGALRVSLAGNTARSVTINTGGGLNASTAASHTINLKNNSGPGLTLNYTTLAVDASVSLPVSLTGTVALQGGLKLNTNIDAGIVSIGATNSPFDIGTVTRVFDIGAGRSLKAVPEGTAPNYDLRTRGPLIGGGPGGGILKTGPGIFRIDTPSTASNSFTGLLEIREGEVRINSSEGLTGRPDLLVSGGLFRVSGGHTQRFTSVAVTKGNIIGSNSQSTVRADSFALNVATGDTATVGTALGDDAAAATLTKTGGGTAILSNPLLYTGQTIINGGTLRLGENAHNGILGNVSPATTVADVRSGRLEFDYTGNESRAAAVLPILRDGFPGNFTSGQIRSSTANANRGLGYFDDVANSRFIVAATLYGDTTLDGLVNFDDLLALSQNYNPNGNGKTWAQGDFTYNGIVDFDDLLKLSQNYGGTALADGGVAIDAALAAGFEADWALARSLVPEPTSLLAMVAAAGTVVRRRR